MVTIPTGRFVWFEYASNDERQAQAFFGELFHWKTRVVATQHGSYTMIALGDDAIGGYVAPHAGAPEHAHWIPHLQVASARESARQVYSLGGKILRAATGDGGFGTMALVTDPLDGLFALWEPAKAESTGGDYQGVDGSWIWNELYTQDLERSIAFYTAIGGFQVETMKKEGDGPGPDRYEILKSNGKGRAGIMKLPDLPQLWMPYVKVASTDMTVEKAKQLGATFKLPAETIPRVGRLAVFMDPLGAPLGILQPSPEM
jgi:uncharacterized protein